MPLPRQCARSVCLNVCCVLRTYTASVGRRSARRKHVLRVTNVQKFASSEQSALVAPSANHIFVVTGENGNLAAIYERAHALGCAICKSAVTCSDAFINQQYSRIDRSGDEKPSLVIIPAE